MEQPASNAGDHVAESRWSIQLFGGFEVRRPDGQSVPLPGRRERILLAYLALHPGHRQSRKNLTEVLWGEAADSTTLDNLRTCLWNLRKALGDTEHSVIVSDREWIGINPDAFEVDAWTLLKLAEREDRSNLTWALDLYNGELLDGIEIASAAFEDWLRDSQMRFREIAVSVFARIMLERARLEDIEGAIEAGQRILRIDKFHEGTVRDLMRMYAEAGRRHIALQTYRAFADRLQKDLGAEPEPETQQLLEQISKGLAKSGDEGDGLPGIEQASPGVSLGSASPASTPLPPAKATSLQPCRAAPPARSRAFRIALWASGVLAGVALGTLITIGIVFWRVPELAPAPLGEVILGVKRQVEADPPSLAVLPFQAHGEPDATAFADAISAGITSALSITSDIVVISRSSVLVYKQRPTAPQQIASELDVRYLVEGNVSKFGDSVNVRVGLIDIAKGEQYIPIGNYEQKASNFFALQKEITLKVVTALQVRLTEGEQERISFAHGTKN